MRAPISRAWLGWAPSLTILCISLTSGCKEDTLVTPPPPPSPGTLVINLITTGGDPDGDGYTLIVDHATVGQVPASSERELAVTSGNHIVELADIAPNCRVSGENPRNVTVGPTGRTAVTFQMDCPHFGAFDIRTSTSGLIHDLDGYVLSIDGTVVQTLALQGEARIGAIRPAAYLLRLSSVESNCSVDGGSGRSVTVEDGQVATVNFSVTCAARTDDTPGEKLLVASQDAQDPNSNLYLMEPDGSGRQRLIDDPGEAVAPEFSRDGDRVLFLKITGPTSTLTIIDRVTRQETTLPTQGVGRAIWAPDGARIVFVRSGKLWGMNSNGTGEFVLTDGPDDRDPYWSPDGTQIAFTRDNSVFAVNAIGPASVRRLSADLRSAGPWSPDGRYLVITKLHEQTCYYDYYYTCGVMPSDLMILDVQTGQEQLLTRTPLQGEWSPAWATDGRSVYFISAPNGNNDVFVAPIDGSPVINVTNSPASETWITVGFVRARASAVKSGKLPRP